jgi:hypothetical protein
MRKLTAIVSASTLLGGAGVAGGARPQPRLMPRRPPSRAVTRRAAAGCAAAALDTIATKLGVTTAKLKAAVEANRPAKPDGGKRGDGDGRATEARHRPRRRRREGEDDPRCQPAGQTGREDPRRGRSRRRPITPS